jgi:hypothetical protein
MNTASNHTAAVWNTKLHDTEALANLHESAKRRAQALRREAVSNLIDGALVWVMRRGEASRRAPAARSEVVCHS